MFKRLDQSRSYHSLFSTLWRTSLPCFDVKKVTALTDGIRLKIGLHISTEMRGKFQLWSMNKGWQKLKKKAILLEVIVLLCFDVKKVTALTDGIRLKLFSAEIRKHFKTNPNNLAKWMKKLIRKFDLQYWSYSSWTTHLLFPIKIKDFFYFLEVIVMFTNLNLSQIKRDLVTC